MNSPQVRRDRRGTEDHQRSPRQQRHRADPAKEPTDAMSDILTLSQIKVPGTATHQGRGHPGGRRRSWSTPARSPPPTWTRCSSGRSRCPPTWATSWPSRTAPTRPRTRSSASALSVVRYDSRSTGTATRSGSRSASPATRRAPGDPGQDRGHLLRHGRGGQDDRGRIGARRSTTCSTRSTKNDRGRADHRHQVMRRPSCTGSLDFLEVTRRSARTPAGVEE